MKNFTKQNFKTNPLWIRLLIMAFMLLLGSSSAWAKYTIYYVNVNEWAEPYCYAWILNSSSEASWAGELMTKTGEKCLGYDVYKYDGTNDSSNRCIFSNRGDNQTGDLTINKGKYYYNDKWYASISEIESEFGIDYLEILKGNKIAFYIGEPSSWEQSKFYLRKNNTTKASTNITFISGNNRLGVVSTAAETGLYVTHSESWEGEIINQAPVAGGAYLCNNSDGYSGCQNLNITALAYSFTLTETTIKTGEACSITEGTKPKTYQGNSTSIRYFVTTDNTNFTEVTFQNGALQTGSLAVGTYTIRPLITDGIIYAIGTDKTLTVETSCKEPSVTLTDNTVTYNGNPQEPTITIESGATPTTVKYNGTAYADGPTNAGTYTLTVWANANDDFCKLEGAEATATFTINPKTPEENDFVYANQTVTYNGEIQSVDVKWKSGYEKTGAITITYKQGDEVKDPINAGTYDVWVTSADSDNFKATESAINKGTLKIDLAEITDVPNNFQLSKTQYNYGEEAKPTVSLKQGSTLKQAGLGVITTRYYNSLEQEVANPTAVGTYTVKITMTDGNGYSAITEPTVVGTFEIVCPDFAEPELIQNASVKRCNGQTIQGGKGSIKVNNYESVYKGKGYTFFVDGTEVSISEDGVLSKEIDIDNSKSEQEYTVTVRNNCGNEKNGNVTIYVENVTPTIGDITISGAGSFCKNTEITLSCNIAGEGTTYQWYKNNTSISGETDQTLTVIVTENATYKVEVIKNTPCRVSRISESVSIVALTRPEAPIFNPETQTVCAEAELTLPTPTNIGSYEISWSIKDAKNTPIVLPLNETTTFVATLSNNGCISEETEYTVNVNPLPVPVISADFEAVNVGETITLTVEGDNIKNIEWYATDGTKEYNVTEITANQATITSDENAIITVTVTATSANDCVATTTKDVTFGSENCEVSNADYVEVLCRTSDGKRDMHCYAWDPNTNKTYLGGWPGVKTDDGDFEYKGKKYAVWQIKTNSDIYIIFSNGNDSKKTGDIKGANDAGLKKGYRYVYTLSSDYKTATLYEEPSIIFAPEVKTLSATCARQSDNSLKVTVTGKIMKKGCAEISSYGFQYKKDGDDYTNVDVCSSNNCNQDAGFIFTKDITLAAGKYGEYTFRARLINENSSKVYGEKITIYYSESDVLIAAVGDDTEVTNKSGVYYDFVGLYVKNVMLPEGAKVESYKWYKGDAVYNSGNVTVADRGVSAANNNIRPNEEGAYKCVVTLDNNTTLTSNVINVTATSNYTVVIPEATAEKKNLPVISVRTNVAFPTCATAGTEGKYPSTNIEGWKEKRSVDVKIFNADGTLYYDRKARMNYRGSSSLNFKKKSYAFCPGEENCGQEKDKTPDYVTTTKMNLFGLSDGAKDKDWVLYAAAADPTLMRNRIVFDTYADMTGKWGVDSKYVELVIDGVYQGVYVLMDKITNNEKRVDITDPNGFIVKFDKTDIADREADLLDAGQEVGDEKTFQTKRTGRVGIQTYNTFVDQLFEIEYPEKKKVVKNGGDWSTTLSAIKQKFEEFETALADGDYIKVRSLIDYESWADWFIINEFTKNVDAYRASCVFVYNGNKIEAQPLWDQELSFNNAAGANIGKKGADKTTGLLIENNGVYTDCFPAPFWFTGRTSNFNTCGTDGGVSTEGSKIENYLLKDECFVATIKERWETHTKEDGALHKTQLMKKYDILAAELGAAKDREIAKWPSDHRVADACGSTGTGYNKVTFDESASTLTEWINKDLVEISSESESASRASNLNYLIENMEGEPLRFDLTLNPASGVTTPWIPITVTVEVPDGYEYTYDDSSIKANEGVIIKSTTNKHSYTFPRPENWNTGNQGEGNEIEPLFYEVNVSLNIETTETASCGESEFETSKTAIISLQDEGDDLCNYAD